MSTPPVFDLDLDLLDPVALRDMAPALIDYLRTARTRQHALMSAWGGPAVCRSCNYQAVIDTTATFTVRIPPGVTDIDLALTCFGTAVINITTSADAVGTELRAVAPGGSNGDETPIKVATGGLISSSAGAGSGRAITVRSSVSWTFADVDLEFDLTGVDSFGILAIETRPIHVPR